MPGSPREVATRLAMLCLVVAPLAIYLPVYLTSHLHQPVPATSWVSWRDDPRTAVHVGWETAGETQGLVRYGIDPADLNLTAVEPAPARIHSVNLTGLAPGTTYHYRIEIGGATHAAGSFRTAPDAFEPFTFALYSDTQQKFGPGWHDAVARAIARGNHSFVAVVGDFVEDGDDVEWHDFFARAAPWLRTTPIVAVEGNHDKPRDGRYRFAEYFPSTVDVEMNKNPYDVHKQTYYSFNWSSVHVQVLHFPEIDLDDTGEDDMISRKDYYRAFTEDHLAWIEQDLVNAQAMPFRISLFHCPITSAGFYGPNFILKEQLLPLLHRYNVTATFHGHAHHYERGLLVNQTHYPANPLAFFLVGTGGGLADVGLRPVPETIVMSASPSYTVASATATTLTITTRALDGAVIDSITFHA